MRRQHDDSGATAVEFALVLPVLLLLLGGLASFGLRAVYGGSAENAARRAVSEARFVQGRTVAEMAVPVCTAALAGLTGPTRRTLRDGAGPGCLPGTVALCYLPPAAAPGACRPGTARPVVGDRVSLRVELQLPFLSRVLGRQAVSTAAGSALGQVER